MAMEDAMKHLEKLENKSIHIIREAYSEFKNLCMLWSIGKDSTVLLWLTRKAFLGHIPFSTFGVLLPYSWMNLVGVCFVGLAYGLASCVRSCFALQERSSQRIIRRSFSSKPDMSCFVICSLRLK